MLDHEEQELVADLAKYSVAPEGRGADGGVGAELQEARRRLGWELPGVAAAFRIPQSHLEALEEGHVSALPAGSALPLLRTYAVALGLNAAELAYRFTGDTHDADDTGETYPEAEAEAEAAAAPGAAGAAPHAALRRTAPVLVGLVLAAGACAAWYGFGDRGKLPREAGFAMRQTAPPAREQASRPAPVPGSSPPAPAASGKQEQDPAADASQVVMVASLAPASVLPAEAAKPSELSPSPEAPPSGGDEWRLVLHATADAWLQVRARSGQVLLSRILHEGEVWPVPPEPDLVLSTGNAGGTELVVDGVPAPSIGNPGAVRRNLPLDPDLIRDGKLPAQMKAATSAQPPGEQPASP